MVVWNFYLNNTCINVLAESNRKPGTNTETIDSIPPKGIIHVNVFCYITYMYKEKLEERKSMHNEMDRAKDMEIEELKKLLGNGSLKFLFE